MKAIILIAVLIGISSCLIGQSGAIYGKVLDKDGPLIGANVVVVGGGSTSGISAGSGGNFVVKPLNAGLYNVEISFVGYKTIKVVGVNVYNNKITYLDDVYLEVDAIIGGEVEIVEYKNKLIDPDEPQKMIIDNKMLIKSPTAKNPAMLAQAYSSDVKVENNRMIVRGSRPGSSTVFIDGVKMRDESSSVSSLIIGSMEIYSGGIPAKYGDVTGGVIIINTKSYFDILNERMAERK